MSMENFEERVRQSMSASIAVKQKLLEDSETVLTIAKVSRALVDGMVRGNKPLLFGNGGSAADAQHIAAEFVGRFAFNRPPLPALALSVNTSSVTAIGNDYGFEQLFARQLEAFGRPGDIAIGISTSGNSQNVIHGICRAKEMGLHTVALTGAEGGNLKSIADDCICAPSSDTPRIQECHILIGHIISELVEATIFHDQSRVSRS
jgi:D-sedoheptulose 7-phosphate isomerase